MSTRRNKKWCFDPTNSENEENLKKFLQMVQFCGVLTPNFVHTKIIHVICSSPPPGGRNWMEVGRCASHEGAAAGGGPRWGPAGRTTSRGTAPRRSGASARSTPPRREAVGQPDGVMKSKATAHLPVETKNGKFRGFNLWLRNKNARVEKLGMGGTLSNKLSRTKNDNGHSRNIDCGPFLRNDTLFYAHMCSHFIGFCHNPLISAYDVGHLGPPEGAAVPAPATCSPSNALCGGGWPSMHGVV